MKRQIATVIITLVSVISVTAKTTYIPSYMSYIHIVNGLDTISTEGIMSELELADQAGMFRILIDHEDVTNEKVKAIKRAKRAAGWMAFATVMSGTSTAFSDNSLQYMVRSTNTQVAATLTGIYTANAQNEQTLGIDMWIENTSGHELMICDTERGLIWWLLPGRQMKMKLHNPEAANFRISDAHSQEVRYVAALAGSKTKKYIIEWEDDDCWITPLYQEGELQCSDSLIKYIRIEKKDYIRSDMSIREYKKFKKEHKK